MEKHREVSKYYEIDCLQNLLLLFMFLFTTNFAKNSPIYTIILFSLFKSVLNQTLNTFNIKFLREWKDRESSYQLGEAFALVFNLLALTLS